MVQKVFFYWKLGLGWTSNTQNFPDCQQINESDWLLVSLQLSTTQGSFFFPGGLTSCQSLLIGSSPNGLERTLSLWPQCISTCLCCHSPLPPPPSLQWQQGNDSKWQWTGQVMEDWNYSFSVNVSRNFAFPFGFISSHTHEPKTRKCL